MKRRLAYLVGLILSAGCAVNSPNLRARYQPDAPASIIGQCDGRPHTTQEVAISNEFDRAHGTLELPAGCGPFPSVLLIAGSGPTDRDGNSPKAGLFPANQKMLAEGLAGRGIASLRYDKAGVGASAGAKDESDYRIDTYVRDAAAWFDALRANPNVSSVILVGHSEGGLIATLVAKRAHPTGVVLLEAAGRPINEVLLEQLQGILPEPLFKESRQILARLERGETSDVPPALAPIFRPSVQHYLISWIKLDPAKEGAELQVPVLVVYGTRDLQTSQADAERIARANPRANVRRIEGMNHVLKLTEGGDIAAQKSTYVDPSLPISAELVDAVAQFAKSPISRE